MYTLVRRYIKTAAAFLALGLTIGGSMLVRRELYGVYPTAYETSAHTHAILVGFVMEMILGVALWLFPRPDKADVRYNPRAAEVAYWLVTVGSAAKEGARCSAARLAARVASGVLPSKLGPTPGMGSSSALTSALP